MCMETEVDFRIFYYTRLAEDMRKNDVKQIVYCRKKNSVLLLVLYSLLLVEFCFAKF
jgi:hypothetical protein